MNTDDTKIAALLRKNRIYSGNRHPEVDLALRDAPFSLEEIMARIRFLKEETLLKVELKPVDSFPLPRSYKKLGEWRFFRGILEAGLPQGKHILKIQLLDERGHVLEEHGLSIFIDLAAPTAQFTAPQSHDYEGSQPKIEINISDEKLKEVLLRPPEDISGIGDIKARYLLHLNIKRIHDLLGVDFSSVYLPGLSRPELLDMITKARFIDRFSPDESRFKNVLNVPLGQLVLSTEESLIHTTGITIQQAQIFLENIRFLHILFDHKIQDKLTLSEFMKRSHSGVKSFQLFLDETDVTSKTVRKKNCISYIPGSPLRDGEHNLRILLWDRAGNKSEATRYFKVDATPPLIDVQSPLNGGFYSGQSVLFNAQVSDSSSGVDPESITLKIDGELRSSDLLRSPAGAGVLLSNLSESPHMLLFECADRTGNRSICELSFTIDRTEPTIILEFPPDQTLTDQDAIEVRGQIKEENFADARIGSIPLNINSDGSFRISLPLVPGANEIRVEATDRAGNVGTSRSITVHRTLPWETGFSGRVLGPGNKPIAGVTVKEPGSGLATLTNDEGYFSLSGLSEGRLLVEIIPPDERLSPVTLPVETKYGRPVIREKPIVLLPVLSAADMQIKTTPQGTVLSNPNAPGLELSYTDQEKFKFPVGTEAKIAIDLVETSLLPFELPDYIPEGPVARLEPSGL